MLIKLALPASFLAPPRRWFNVGMAALLVAATIFAAMPAGGAAAAVCASQADGNWEDGATWAGCTGAGGTPDAADEVTVTHMVALNADQSVGSLSIGAGGVVYFTTPATLTVSTLFEVNGGVFAAEILDENGDPTNTGGTVAFAAGAQQVLTHGAWVDFWDLTKIATGAGQSLAFDPAVADAGGVHILNALTMTGDATDALALQSTVPGSQWQIWTDDAYIVDYVSVSDSKNASPTVETIHVANGTDAGNNTGWIFGAPTVILASDLNPAPEESVINFTATTAPAGAGGLVTFMNGAAAIPGCVDVPVVNDTAVCTVNSLGDGSYDITAVYSTFSPLAPATSNIVTQLVGSVVTIDLNSLVNPAAASATVTLQASVSPATTVGTVKFSDADGDPLAGCASVAINAGKAICQVSLPAGSHEISAEYIEGDAHSNVLTQLVKDLSTVTLESSHPSASFGQVITFTARVTAPAGATGTVTFKKGAANVAGCVNVPLVAGEATCDVEGLMPGTYSFSVVYSGDATTFGLEPAAISQFVDLIYFYMPIIQN